MKKVVLFFIIFFSSILVASDSLECFEIEADILHARSKPDLSSSILGYYSKGERICTKEIEDNWARGDRGWFFTKFSKNLSKTNDSETIDNNKSTKDITQKEGDNKNNPYLKNNFQEGFLNQLSYELERNREIEISKLSEQIANKEISIQKNTKNPTLQISAATGVERIKNPNSSHESKGTSRGSITLSKNLFDGFMSDIAIDIAKISKNSALKRSEFSKISLVGESLKIYLEISRNRELLKNAKELEDLFDTLLRSIEKEIEIQNTPKADMLMTKNQLLQSRQDRLRIENDLTIALSKYKRVLQRDIKEVKEIDIVPMLANTLPKNLDEYLNMVASTHPQIDIYNDLEKMALKRVELASSELYPRMSMVLRSQFGENEKGVDGERVESSAMLEVEWNAMSILNSKDQKQRARYDALLQNEQKEVLVEKLLEEAQIRWITLKNLDKRIEIQNELLENSQEIYKLTKDGVRLGLQNRKDELRGYATYLQSKVKNIELKYEKARLIVDLVSMTDKFLEY